MTTEQLRSQLFSLAEPAYQAFSSSLLPGVSGVLGVRLPVCRKIARQLGKDGWQDWLEEFFALPDPFFEEAMIAGMTIALTPMDPEERIRLIRRFLPRIQNWSVCDTFCGSLKDARLYPQLYWTFLSEFFTASEPYYQRFALVMGLSHFVTPAYLEPFLARIDAFSHPDYYAQMAAAWALSICFIQFPEETLPHLLNSPLDNFTYNKALQKICDSFRVSPETKAQIRALRRKK